MRAAVPCAAFLLAAVAAAGAGSAVAQTPVKPGEGIFTCVDERGRRLTSDRPIPECVAREQRLLNRDGSLRQVIPPTLTAEERAAKEARERLAAEDRAAQQDAVRRDRNLLQRFPNEAAHQRARQAALEPVQTALANTDRRLADLARERLPLTSEAEFYAGKALPPKLKTSIDANDAAVEAQKAARVTQAAELARVTALFDAELERLRKLWSGAPAGSLGPLPQGVAIPATPGSAPSQAAAPPAASALPAPPPPR